MHIRHATQHDAAAISQLVLDNARLTLAPHYTDVQMEVFERYYSPEAVAAKIARQITWCYCTDDTPTAQMIGTIALDGHWMVGFYTHRDQMGAGIGKTLLRTLEAHAQASGLQELWLAASPVGVEWYLRQGYTAIETKVFTYLGVDFEETEMVKRW